MNPTEYGVTPQGFKVKRLIDIKNELEDYFIGEFGEINLDAQSVAGQIIGIFSKVLADIWENQAQVYESQYPNSASGVALDNVVQYNGITRLAAQRTTVIGVVTGTEGTLIPSGSLARIPGTGQQFSSTISAYITRSNSVQNIVRVDALAPQNYTVVLSGVSYSYSLPTINFSGPIQPSNLIDVHINGVSMPQVAYAASSPATLADLANQIQTNSPAVLTAVVNNNSIELTPNVGFQITVNSVEVSGPGAPTASTSLRQPASLTDIATNLAAVVNNSSVATAVSNSNSFTITARDTEIPYSLNLGTNLTLTQLSSPIPFIAQDYGPIPVPINSLTEILTPIAGWQSITNFKAGVTGRFQETDEELRLRRANSLRVLGSGTVEAIRARLLQEVPGVTSVLVFENVTLTQDPIEVTFSANFDPSNSIQVFVDTVSIGNIAYQGSQIATMNAIAALLLAQDEIKNVTVGGVGDQELLIEMEDTQEIEVSFTISGSNPPTYITSGGRPPKSFEAVVEGGTDQAVALKIWQLKPAGIQTFGNINDGAGVEITDSQGNPQFIHFTRASPIYIWATVALVLNPQETFPANGQQQVANAILAYGNSLGIGVDVFIQRVQAAVFSVPGIAQATVQLARTLNPNDSPSYANTNIEIGQTEVSTWDLSRITVSL